MTLLIFSIKWIKGGTEWQTNLAPLATHFPQSPHHTFHAVLTPTPPLLLLRLLSLPLYVGVTLNLSFQ